MRFFRRRQPACCLSLCSLLSALCPLPPTPPLPPSLCLFVPFVTLQKYTPPVCRAPRTLVDPFFSSLLSLFVGLHNPPCQLPLWTTTTARIAVSVVRGRASAGAQHSIHTHTHTYIHTHISIYIPLPASYTRLRLRTTPPHPTPPISVTAVRSPFAPRCFIFPLFGSQPLGLRSVYSFHTLSCVRGCLVVRSWLFVLGCSFLVVRLSGRFFLDSLSG